MAKKGQHFPYRIVFQYPDRPQYTDVIKNQERLISRAKFFLTRGASIELISVDTDGSKRQFAAYRPEEIPEETLEQWREEGYHLAA